MDASAVVTQYHLAKNEEEFSEQSLNSDMVYPLQQFTQYPLELLEELGFSKFLQDERVHISVNWELKNIKGNKHSIQQTVSKFEADIVREDLELKEPGIQNLIFYDSSDTSNENISSYIQNLMIKMSIKHYYLRWIPDYKTPDEVKGNIYCRYRDETSLAKVIEEGFCSFPRADESSDVKEVIRIWKEKRKLVEAVARDGQKTITCTLDVKQKIEEERNKTLKKSNPVRAAYAQFLAKHKSLLDTISHDMHVEIHFNSDISTLVLEGTYSNIKLAILEIKSKMFEDSLHIQTYPTGNLAQEFNRIADTYNCGWTVLTEGNPQEVGHLTGCDYVASWYDPTRNTSFTVIEGETHDLNVDCLIALCTDNLFPLQFKQDKEMIAAIQEYFSRANKSHDVGDVVLKDFEHRNYKHAAFLVAGQSNPPSKGANKTFHGLSSKLKSVFMKAEINQWKTVCLPACSEEGFLSTNNIVEAYLDAVIAFQKEKKPLQFYLFCENGKGLGIQDLLKKIQKRYKAEIGFFRKIHQHGVLKFKDLGKNSKPCIEVVEESIENMQVDIIVNTTSKTLDLKAGKVSNKLQSLAGDEMQAECKRQYPNGIDYTTVAVTSPYRLKNTNRYINYVFHGAIPKFKRDSYVQNVKTFVWCCMAEADRQKCKSIAFPALGTGARGYPGRETAKAMFDAVEEYRIEAVNPHVERVVFSLYSGDKDICMVFKREQQRRHALNDVVKTKCSHPPYKEIKTNARTLIGIISRKPHPVKVIVGVSTDIGPLDTNVVEIKTYSSTESDIKWKYSNDKPQTLNDQLLVSRRESKHSHTGTFRQKPNDNSFKGAINNALKYCINNNIAEIAFDIDSGTADVTDSAKVEIIATELEHCLSGRQEEMIVLHTIYVRLIDIHQFDSVTTSLLDNRWFPQARSLLSSVNPLGSNLNWQIQDSSTNDKHVGLEIVGESPEVVQTVKQQMLQEASRFYDDSSSARSDIGSSVDNGYNGARPKTRQLDKDKNTEQITPGGRFKEEEENPHTSEESEEDFEVGEAFKVSAQINPVYIEFKERYNDAERWKDLVENTYGVKMSTDEHQGCRVHGTYRQIIDTKTYLDKKFPLDPTPIKRKKRSINISQRKESDKMLVNKSLTSDPGKGLDLLETHYKHEETLFLNGGELESLLFMNDVSYSFDNKPSQMTYDERRSALVIIGTDKCLKEVKKKHSKFMRTVTRREVKLIGMNETSQGDAAANQTIDDKVLCKFIPQDDTIAIVGVDERSAKEFEKRIFKFLGRNGSNPNMGPGDENTTRQPSGLEMPKHFGNIGKQKSDGMTVKIYECEMKELSVDCLVVPYSTKSLPLTVRVMKAAGDKFKTKLKETIQNLGPFTSCECRETDPGKLENLKKIIHMSLDEKNEGISTNMLEEAVTNSLRKANELDMENVAILLTGVNDSVNFSHFERYFDAIKGFTRETTRPIKVKEIHLVHHNDQITNEAKDTFKRMSAREGIETQGSDFIFVTARTWNRKSPGVQPYPNTRPLQEPGTFVVGRSNVKVLAAMGDVRRVKADGIVCIQDEFFSFGNPTAKHIYDMCGQSYRSKIDEAMNLTQAEGYILAIPTAGGSITCKYVINVVLPKWKLELPEGVYVSTLKGTVSDILQKSEELKLTSLAMPYLESYDVSSDERTTSQPFCEAMVSSILQFFKNDKQFHLKILEILVENPEILSDFVQMFKQFGKDV